MEGTIVITGANGSLAIPAVAYLLRKYPNLTVILTVRDTTDGDVNTKRLRKTIAQFPNAKAFIHQLDLSKLTEVHKFADDVSSGISNGTYPRLKSIICNAFHWNLVSDGELTSDGFEKAFQINHIAHVALVLRLVDEFGTDGGRIVFLSSNAHWPGKNQLEKHPPDLPDDLDLLVKVSSDSDKAGRGFQRYANSKLAITSYMYALNRHLEKVLRSSLKTNKVLRR
jgi:NAD(P)-dependent dehydrogenase (short-subunit alcohol dehydrogenase family)